MSATLLMGCAGAQHEPTYIAVGLDDGPLTVMELDGNGGGLSITAKSDIFDANYLSVSSSGHVHLVQPDKLATYNVSGEKFDHWHLVAQTSSLPSPTAVETTENQSLFFTAHFFENTLSARAFDGKTFSAPQNFECNWAHQFQSHPNQKWAYGACMKNTLMQFDVDPAVGKVTPMATAKITLPGGPRHMEFHPGGQQLYVILQISSEIAVFDIDRVTGELQQPPKQIIKSTLEGSKNKSSDLHITPNGKWLYAFNRKNQEMVIFSVSDVGFLELTGIQSMSYGEVRHWAMTQDGSYLITGTDKGHLGVWDINARTGGLTLRSELSGLGKVVSVAILP